ncbi:MAG: 3-dehydroquinate synthase, partial [Bacteroidia bacterium]
GLLKGEDLWNQFSDFDPQEIDSELLTEIVKVKIDVVNEDPKEMGIRKSLNLGHTIGHAIESEAMETGNPLPHGHAVMLGLLAELKISENELGLDSEVVAELSKLADRDFESLKSHDLDFESLYPFMKMDKKNELNEVRFALLREVGKAEVDISVPEESIKLGIDYLKEWQGR